MKCIIEGFDEFEVLWYGLWNLKKYVGVVSFNVLLLYFYDVVVIFDEYNIMVCFGYYCVLFVMKKFGVEGIVRVLFYVYNSVEEVEMFLSVMENLVRGLRG